MIPKSATYVRALQTPTTAVAGHDWVILQVWILSSQLHPAAEAVCEMPSLRIIAKYHFTTHFNWKPQPLCATKKCCAEVLAFNFFKEMESSYVLHKAANNS